MVAPVISARTNPDYKKLLYALPPYSTSEHAISLDTIVDDDGRRLGSARRQVRRRAVDDEGPAGQPRRGRGERRQRRDLRGGVPLPQPVRHVVGGRYPLPRHTSDRASVWQ